METALINIHIIYRDLPANKGHTVEHFDLHLATVHDFLQAGSASMMKSSSCIPATYKSVGRLPWHKLPTRLVTKHTPLPLCQKVTGMHTPLWMESRVDCSLCRWRRSQGGSGEGMKTSIKWEGCNEALCVTGGVGRRWCECCWTEFEVRIEEQGSR